MIQVFEALNSTDRNHYPAGGHVSGPGIEIKWSQPFVVEPPDDQAHLLTVLAAVQNRLEWLQQVQDGIFWSDAHKNALKFTLLAMDALLRRERPATPQTPHNDSQVPLTNL